MASEPGSVIAAIDELLEGWDTFCESVRVTPVANGARRGRDRTMAQFAVVISLVTHVHAVAKVLRPAMPDGITVAHMPLVRSIYEATLTAAWCDEVPDSAEAIMKEEGRQRRNLDVAMRSAASFASAKPIPHVDWAEVETPSAVQGRNFEKLADDVALDGAYVLFKILSSFSHATVRVVDEYLIEGGGDLDMSFKEKPDPLGSEGWTLLVAACLVWAGMVANFYDPARTRRNALRAIAKRLEVSDELPIKMTAINRGSRRKVRPKSRSQ